ncbi:MAG: glycine--tRNA ligase subunit beta [Candidatus Omnitrophica bacterium]|nr:glycine--tRNA ligase subunit beta [Candidatus Omnitrophota bacterium]
MTTSSQLPASSRVSDLLFEIGTEELPAAYLPGLIDQLRVEAEKLLQANRLAFQKVETFGAPRRLVLVVLGLDAVQRRPAEEIRGPSKQAAYDKDGKPTPALLGFLKSRGGALSDVKLVSSEKGEYVFFLKSSSTTPTPQVLSTLLPQLVTALRAPKTMRWDASSLRFARPIRWTFALYGTTPIRYQLGRLSSTPSRTMVGLPTQPKAVTVKSHDAYHRALKQAGIVLDHAERRRVIEQKVTRMAAASKGKTAPEMLTYGLLDEVTHLVECPIELSGRFDPKYLVLPREVLLASMAKHQRVFAVESGGKLQPTCIAILEGKPGKPAEVRAVIERILNARLADSLLVLKEDREHLPLEHMAKRLSGVTFHEKIGTMAQKSERLETLSETLAQAWDLDTEERLQLRRACVLAKADLVSTMVKEFPTLQGVIGKYYALDSGESPATATAIEEHYLPLAEKAPKTLIGSALSIIDKLDTLTSYFAIGIMPTGDQDPFGLRRAAQGIVEVAWNVRRPFPFARLRVGEPVRRYLLERLFTFAWPAPSPSADCIQAVLASPCEDLVDAMDRIHTLQRLHQRRSALLKAAKVVERTRNILVGTRDGGKGINQALFQEPLEKALWSCYTSSKARIEQLIHRRSYADATAAYGETFFDPIHEFFDKVMVNVDDEQIRTNRQALMRAINVLYTARVADLSKLTILQQQPKE